MPRPLGTLFGTKSIVSCGHCSIKRSCGSCENSNCAAVWLPAEEVINPSQRLDNSLEHLETRSWLRPGGVTPSRLPPCLVQSQLCHVVISQSSVHVVRATTATVRAFGFQLSNNGTGGRKCQMVFWCWCCCLAVSCYVLQDNCIWSK
jgi:hypothetical protein